jgi:RNA polymerase sigma-70 factor, ECF subfamily
VAACERRGDDVSDELEAREAVRQAYSAYYRRLVAALYGMTGDYSEAQDVVQEAYARALTRSRAFLDVADPEAWLRTVAVNIARTRWRRRKLFDTLVRTGRVARTPESVPGADPNRVALVAALQKLSRPTREAIVLHHLADMPVYEVAQALGVPVGTVKARLSRGRTILAKLLSELADEPTRATLSEPLTGPLTAGSLTADLPVPRSGVPGSGLPAAGPPPPPGLPGALGPGAGDAAAMRPPTPRPAGDAALRDGALRDGVLRDGVLRDGVRPHG